MTKNVNPQYSVVIGDAVASRALAVDERTTLQARLHDVLADVNRRWAGAVAAPFTIVLGDQFEGVLEADAPAWDVIHFLRAELRAVDWIIACGRGAITTPLSGATPELDGPSFHLAREALEQAKANRMVLAFAGFADDSLAALAAYYSALYWSWTSRQRRVANMLRVIEPSDVAERLGVDRSAISHVSRRMRWDLVTAADAAFRRRLEAS